MSIRASYSLDQSTGAAPSDWRQTGAAAPCGARTQIVLLLLVIDSTFAYCSWLATAKRIAKLYDVARQVEVHGVHVRDGVTDE